MSDDLYDFTGVTFDLELLKSELRSLQAATDKHLSNLTRSRNPCLETEVNVEDDDEEWFPPTPPVYDVTEKLIEVNRIFHDDPTSTIHEANRLRWRTGSALVQIKYMYFGESGDEEHEEDEESHLFFNCPRDKLDLNYPSDSSSKRPFVDYILENPVYGHPTAASDTSSKVSSNNFNLQSSFDPKPPALPKKVKHSEVKESNNRQVATKTSSDWKPLTLTAKIPRSDLPQTRRKVERHKSSDSILEIPVLPPVSRRRYSSQDRLIRSNSKPQMTAKSVPLNVINRPQQQQNGSCSDSSINCDKPRQKYSSRLSSAPIPIARMKNSNSFSGPVHTIVLEQVSLVNDNKSRTGHNMGRPNLSSSGTSTTRLCPLRRNISYNSISSSSSVSSQAPEETSLTSSSSSTDSINLKRPSQRTPVVITHPGITVDIGLASDGAVNQWKERKREEKRLCERRAFLQSQMRRLS